MPKFNPLDHPISFAQPLRIAPSSWMEHVPFAMFIVDILRPEKIVELGTHYGVSYCAFCQAVCTLKLNTRCYAVDTWQGDDHAGHYGEDILVDLKTHHDPLYSNFSQLIQNTFENALDYFENGTIDLLHIDGFHIYDTVKGDFNSWLPKMSRRGVVLFHDVAVKDADFGVWKLWDELKPIYPHFDFSHGCGLGVLAVGSEYPLELDLLIKKSSDQAFIREYFLQMGLKLKRKNLLSEQVDEKELVLKEIINSKPWKLLKLLERIPVGLWPVDNFRERLLRYLHKRLK
jgi:hypothetical protein